MANQQSREYIDKYIAQALAQRQMQQPQQVAQQAAEKQALMQALAQQQQQMQPMNVSRETMPAAQLNQLGAPPADYVSNPQAQELINNAYSSTGDNAGLEVGLAGILSALENLGKSKADKAKKEYLMKALESGDPNAIALAGEKEIAANMWKQQENQADREFKSNLVDRGYAHEDSRDDRRYAHDDESMRAQQAFQMDILGKKHEFTHGENELNRQRLRAQALAEAAQKDDENVQKQENAFMASMQKKMKIEDFLALQKNPNLRKYLINNYDEHWYGKDSGNDVNKQFPVAIDWDAVREDIEKQKKQGQGQSVLGNLTYTGK